MNSLKESILIFLASLAIGGMIGFVFGEKSMCNQVGGMYSADFGRCFEIKNEVRVK